MASIYDWSTIAADNATADSGVNWAEGQAPSTVNNSARVMMQRNKELLNDIGGITAVAGTTNALTLTAASAFTAYENGLRVSFRAVADNTTAVTLNVNGIGAKPIVKFTTSGETALSGAEIQQTGIYEAVYSEALNGAAGAWLLLNPSPAPSVVLAAIATSGSASDLSTGTVPNARISGAYTGFTTVTLTSLNFASTLTIGDGGEDFRFNADGFLSNGLTVTKTAINDAGTGLSFHKSGIIWVSRDGLAGGFYNRDTSDGILMQFGRSKTAVGNISVTTVATAYNTSSDERMKHDFRPIDPSLIDQIAVYDFAWNADGAERAYGVKAQELYSLIPQAVSQGETPEAMWSVDYSKLVPLLIAKVQNLEARLAQLEQA